MKVSRKATIAVAAIVVLGAISFLWLRASKDEPGKLHSINFGTVPTAATTLIYIAEDQHFFEANSLIVNITDYNTGMATTEELLKGDLDIAWVAEFPFVHRAFAQEKISIIAVVGQVQ